MKRLFMAMVCVLLMGCDSEAGSTSAPEPSSVEDSTSAPELSSVEEGSEVARALVTEAADAEVETADSEEPAITETSGTFFVAMKMVIAPDLPLQFVATQTWTDNGDGTASLAMTLQPLSLDITSTSSPREFIGDPIDLGEFPVDENGAFEVDAGEVNLPGGANPISGSPITATLSLKGTIEGEDLVCGAVQGMVTAPINAPLDYNNSSFAAVRIQDASGPYPTYGEDMLLECPEGTED